MENKIKVIQKIVCALAFLLAAPISAQSQEDNSISISYLIGFVSVVSDDSQGDVRRSEEGDILQVGNTIRTGDDSAVRIIFPNGTAQTLCANTTYRVLDRGSEDLEQGADNNIQTVAAFSRCKLRPRYRTRRCFFDRNTDILNFDKAGTRAYVDNLTPERTDDRQSNLRQLDQDDKRLKLSNQRDFCTLGERLQNTFIAPQEPEPQIVTPSRPPVPAPEPAPVTVPAPGGSPI